MRYHLDPVGGVAGDMFAAAMLDCHPEWQSELGRAFTAAGFDGELQIAAQAYSDSILTGHRFEVRVPQHRVPHHHAWRDIRALIQTSALSESVRERAVSIFSLLAEAEAKVHGKPVADITFHEVGEWDSIADVVCAAWLIEQASPASWTSAALPAGRGRVASAHGRLPVPAPAVSVLLRGFPLFDDGLIGERITPTGAAILRYLDPSFAPVTTPMRLEAEGYGFGTRSFEGISNVLRVLRFEPVTMTGTQQSLAVCQFEVDDQSPEDLSVGLDKLRELEGVLDVVQSMVQGKKGRLAIQVQLLAEPAQLDAIIDRCLIETTTLGVRWQLTDRRVVSRTMEGHDVMGKTVRVKHARRPDGQVTGKAEMDDLADAPDGHAGRQKRRREAETMPPSTCADGDRERVVK